MRTLGPVWCLRPPPNFGRKVGGGGGGDLQRASLWPEEPPGNDIGIYC